MDSAIANGEITREIFSTESTLRLLVAGLGGLVAALGVLLTVRAARATSAVEISGGKWSLNLRNVSQGVLVVLAGCAILAASLYYFPEHSSIETIRAKEIIERPDGSRLMAK
jgi:hypothetical protein